MKNPVKCEICGKSVPLISRKGSDPVLILGRDTSTCQNDHPILSAAKIGDKRKLGKLLQEKKENASSRKNPVYPEDWKYTFEDLLKTDKDGRTALHLAAIFGDHVSALRCVQLILESHQVCIDEDIQGEQWDYPDKNVKLLECMDTEKEETALHLAIKNKAVAVVSYLLENQANILATNKAGTPALELIYTQVPDAMKELYDGCITLKDITQGDYTAYDHTRFTVNWGPVVGYRLKGNDDMLPKGNRFPGNQTSLLVHDSPPGSPFWDGKETKCISYILGAEKWGTNLLSHPLIKWYLHLKWERIRWFFWITFWLQIIWLSIYAAIFVDLQLDIAELKEENCTKPSEGVPAVPNASKNVSGCSISTEDLKVNWVWHFMTVVTILELAKEVYQMFVLRLKMYWSSPENVLQLTFIGLFAFQYITLLCSYSVDTDVLASVSAIAIITSAILMIFQLGKTPRFGLQVAAFRKVFKSCAPHLPIFIIWFLGFGLAFWAMFYNAETSWTLGMVAIIAAMGTGELNAKENLENFVTGSFSLPELIHVFCILLFVIVIVTLYFNLLVGHAVTDLQVLLPKAETLNLANKLNTIYTIESFLVSPPGKILVAARFWILGLIGKQEDDVITPSESIYVLPPSQLDSNGGYQDYSFFQLPEDQLDTMRKIAFVNFVKEKEKEDNQEPSD